MIKLIKDIYVLYCICSTIFIFLKNIQIEITLLKFYKHKMKIAKNIEGKVTESSYDFKKRLKYSRATVSSEQKSFNQPISRDCINQSLLKQFKNSGLESLEVQDKRACRGADNRQTWASRSANTNNKLSLICLVFLIIATCSNCQTLNPQIQLNQAQLTSQLPRTFPQNRVSPLFKKTDLKDKLEINGKQLNKAQPNADENITNINLMLAAIRDAPFYYGANFNSLGQAPVLDYIGERTGEIRFTAGDYQVQAQAQQTNETYFSEQQNKRSHHNLQIQSILSPPPKQQSQIFQKRLKGSIKAVSAPNAPSPAQQPVRNYTILFQLLNPKYITQQVLDLEINVFPNKFNRNESNVTAGEEVCRTLSPYEWQCDYTNLTYSKLWRLFEIQRNTVNVSYHIKLTYNTEFKDQYDPGYIGLTFTIMNAPQPSNASPQIHIQSNSQLQKIDRITQQIPYIVFLVSTLLLQLYSAKFVVQKLNDNHAMANKLSLVTVCFCTIYDLSNMITFVYRIIGAADVYSRILFILPAICFGILYFFYDIQLLTRILICKYHNRVQRAGPNNNTLSKILIGFYLVLFISYQGFVLLFAYFQYEWWLILLTSCFILIPQIIHNIRIGNGGHGGFSFAFVIGFLASRYLIMFYEHGCPYNYLKIKPFAWISITLFVLLSIQLAILYFQSKIGARFFIPQFMRGNYYRYAFKLKLQQITKQQNLQCNICLLSLLPDQIVDEMEKSSPQNEISESAKNSQMQKTYKQNGISQLLLNKSAQNKSNVNAQGEKKSQSNTIGQLLFSKSNKNKTADVYKTPCNHMFHEECLKQWMQVKLECPTCRNQLPVI